MALDLNKISIAEYEFSGEELGELLLESIQQIKQGKSHERKITNAAIEARAKTGLSQSEFANLMGISVRTLQSWELGRRNPTGAAATLLKIAARYPETMRGL